MVKIAWRNVPITSQSLVNAPILSPMRPIDEAMLKEMSETSACWSAW
jgi:hypothetical protein